MDRRRLAGEGISRRAALRTLGTTGLAVAGLSRAGPGRAEGAAPPAPTAPQGVALRALPFDLKDVRLLDGPFQQAQQRDARYLLTLEPDRLLHNFRKNAGLPPKAEIYGGWESAATWADIRCHGHSLGHYLSACALMYASTGAASLKERIDYVVGELRACQDAAKSGLVCAFPEGGAIFDNVLGGRRFPGVPWYTMHKIFAGLRDAHVQTGSKPARDALVRLADWAVTATARVDDASFQRMLNIEHGGMNEVLADVYALTGEAKYLALARRFCHRVILEPLAQLRDTLGTLHANTQIPKVIGFNRLYALTGEQEYRAASAFFWQTVVTHRSFVTGGHGDQEHFFPPADFPRHANSAKNMETCCTHNMLKLTRMLFALDPAAAYADYYERALYNGILSSQDPDSGMMTYFQGTRPGYMKLYCTPTDSFWCCTGTGMENHAKYGDSIYFHDVDSIYINLFIPSSITWREKGITLTQTTRFPEEGKTKLQWTAGQPTELTLNVRHPGWCAAATITLNGSPLVHSEKPGSYIPVKRRWQSGDVLEIAMPMTLHTVALPGASDTVAFMYGPIVLAGALGNQGIAPGADLIINERTYGNVLNEPFAPPTLAGDPAKIVQRIAPVAGAAALTFRTSGLGRPGDVLLVPYYRIAHERYAIYWKLGTA